MSANTTMIFTKAALIKVIDDHDGVRVKLCPALSVPNALGERYDEVEGSLEAHLGWTEINRLAEAAKRHRDRVFGKPVL